MSYNPSTGVYSLPAIYLAIPGTVIIAAQHNTPLEDLATANNYARPVIAGGTGSNTAIGAANSLKVISAGGSQSLTDAEKQQARDNITSARVDVASAATTLIAAANSQYVRVTGTTDITAFDAADSGTEISILFSASLILTHNGTSLILPGAANVTTAAGDVAVFVSEGGTNWRLTDYTFASSMPAAYAGVPDFVQGLTPSNNSGDPNNDIDLAPGTAKVGQRVVTNSGTFTKRLDAAWAAGSGNGGLDTGSKANSSWYYEWPLRNTTTGAFDAIFSLSATSGGVTVPSGYEVFAPLGSYLVAFGTDASGNIRQFKYSADGGDETYWYTARITETIPGFSTTAVTASITAPPLSTAIIAATVTSPNAAFVIMTPIFETDVAPAAGLCTLSHTAGEYDSTETRMPLDASRLIRLRASAVGQTLTASTRGYQVPSAR